MPAAVQMGLRALTTDKLFESVQARVNTQLARVDYLLQQNPKELLNKKFSLYGLYKDATQMD
jgi:hypothetical protein